MITFKRIVLFLLFALAASPLYKFLFLLWLVYTFNDKLNAPKYVYFIVLAVGIFFCIPRYNTGRLRLLYEEKGELVAPSKIDYVLDCIIPEEEFMNVGTKGFSLFPFPFKNHPNWVVQTAYNNRYRLSNFVKPYADLPNNVMSGVWGQLHGKRTVYLNLPKKKESKIVELWHYIGDLISGNSDKVEQKESKLVVFCHGYAGNWKMYQGILNQLDDCIVLSMGTKDISGTFNQKDIKKIFTNYIPYIEKKGYKIKDVHIIGLSNGASAISTAVKSFPTQFKSYTTMSGNLWGVHRVSGSINFLGGKRDGSSGLMPSQHKQCKQMGMKSTLYFPDDDHFLLVNKTEQVVKTLNEIIQ